MPPVAARTLAEAHRVHLAAVQHAGDARPSTPPAFSPPSGSCARCGGPLPAASSGLPRPGVRYCAASCRHAAVRERRADSRADLLAAIGDMNRAVARVEACLRTLGLHPKRPRRRARS